MPTLSQKSITNLLNRLNDKLADIDKHGELYLVGGAVMCLAFNARDATKDVDAQFAPTELIRKLAEEIATEKQLDKNWLNDAVKGYLSPKANFQNFLELSHLNVFVPTPDYLLAMKCLAMRLGPEFHDETDVRYLLRYLNITDYQTALNTIQQYYPSNLIPEKTHYALEEILQGT